jgi:chemotaxis protein CheD
MLMVRFDWNNHDVLKTTTSQIESIVVGMGEFHVLRSTNTVLSCIGLGSCIAVCAYDGITKVGGIVHIVLPKYDGKDNNSLAKYADTAIPLLFKEITIQGGIKSYLTVKLVGGAQMSIAPGINNSFRTGEKNLVEVIASLGRERIPIAAADTGGTKGRTVKMYMETGRVTVRTIGGSEREI